MYKYKHHRVFISALFVLFNFVFMYDGGNRCILNIQMNTCRFHVDLRLRRLYRNADEDEDEDEDDDEDEDEDEDEEGASPPFSSQPTSATSSSRSRSCSAINCLKAMPCSFVIEPNAKVRMVFSRSAGRLNLCMADRVAAPSTSWICWASFSIALFRKRFKSGLGSSP